MKGEQRLPRAEVSLGDLVRALAVLAPEGEADRRAIVEGFGFQLAAPTTERATPGPTTQPSPVIPEQAEAPPRAHLRERQFTLAHRPSRGNRIQTVPMPSATELPVGAPEDTLPRPPLEPLFQPRWSRAVIATLAKRKGQRGRPDIAELVAIASRKELLRSLPVTATEIASGADVLVDVGESMQLFARDQQAIVSEMRRVLGKSEVAVFRFVGSPMQGVTAERRRDKTPYLPRGPGWPIILLTDLGLGSSVLDRASAGEWATLASIARANAARLLALVPYPRRRWPGSATAVTAVVWDRETSPRTVRATLRRSPR